jgi:hypothetical protein
MTKASMMRLRLIGSFARSGGTSKMAVSRSGLTWCPIFSLNHHLISGPACGSPLGRPAGHPLASMLASRPLSLALVVLRREEYPYDKPNQEDRNCK